MRAFFKKSTFISYLTITSLVCASVGLGIAVPVVVITTAVNKRFEYDDARFIIDGVIIGAVTGPAIPFVISYKYVQRAIDKKITQLIN